MLICLLGLGAAPGAGAANLGILGDSMRLTEGAAETNNITVARDATNYVVTDTVPIATAAPCANVIATVAILPGCSRH